MNLLTNIFFHISDLDTLVVQTNDPDLVDVVVSTIADGTTAGDTSFAFDYGGVQSDLLSTTSTADEVKLVIS